MDIAGRLFGIKVAERRAAVERVLAESALSDEAKVRYLFRFHDRLKAVA